MIFKHQNGAEPILAISAPMRNTKRLNIKTSEDQ